MKGNAKKFFALLAALSLLAAYAQEAAWTGETAVTYEPVPSAVIGYVLN